MLTGDFVIRSTSSPHGTKFDEFFSDTYGMLAQAGEENLTMLTCIEIQNLA